MSEDQVECPRISTRTPRWWHSAAVGAAHAAKSPSGPEAAYNALGQRFKRPWPGYDHAPHRGGNVGPVEAGNDPRRLAAVHRGEVGGDEGVLVGARFEVDLRAELDEVDGPVVKAVIVALCETADTSSVRCRPTSLTISSGSVLLGGIPASMHTVAAVNCHAYGNAADAERIGCKLVNIKLRRQRTLDNGHAQAHPLVVEDAALATRIRALVDRRPVGGARPVALVVPLQQPCVAQQQLVNVQHCPSTRGTGATGVCMGRRAEAQDVYLLAGQCMDSARRCSPKPESVVGLQEQYAQANHGCSEHVIVVSMTQGR